MPTLPTYSFGTNLTDVSSPVRTQDDLICLPGRWTTVLRFFVLNYVVHAFTIWARPGEKTSEKLFAVFLAMVFPVAGLARGIEAICRCAAFHRRGGFWKGLFGFGTNKYEIHKAARAGALGIMIRTPKWKVASSDCFALNYGGWERTPATLRGIRVTEVPAAKRVYRIEVEGDYRENEKDGLRYESPPDDLRWSREINGLAANEAKASAYRIIKLHKSFAKHVSIPEKEESTLRISQNSNILISLIAVAQIVYAAYSLARVTGDQFEHFGYSAFHLTVLPYMVMSFVNLLGNLATPTYPSIYLVGTTILEEARLRGLKFSDPIGYIHDRHFGGQIAESNTRTHETFRIKPWSCHRDEAKIDPNQDADTAALLRRDQLDDNIEVLKVCFSRREECEANHVGTLKVPSGIPRKENTRPWVRAIFGIVAVGAHIGPIVYYALKYGQPRSVLRRVIFPLWIALGDFFGLYLLYQRMSVSTLLQFLAWLTRWFGCGSHQSRKAKTMEISTRPAVALTVLILGLVIAVWNFWIVGVQILDFGACVNISDSV